MSLKLVLLVLVLEPELLGQSRSLCGVVDQLIPTAIQLQLEGGDLGLKPQGGTLLLFVYPLTVTPFSFKVLLICLQLEWSIVYVCVCVCVIVYL